MRRIQNGAQPRGIALGLDAYLCHDMLRWILASLHLLALPIGLAAVWQHARALRGSLDNAGIRRVLGADTWWGVAAVLWLSTGLWRWLGGIEKARDYYLTQPMFYAKLGLFVLLLLLELWPMVTFVRWRAGHRTSRGTGYIETAPARANLRDRGDPRCGDRICGNGDGTRYRTMAMNPMYRR